VHLRSRSNICHCIPAGALAAPARFAADTAMLMFACVALAFFCAARTRDRAQLERCVQDGLVRSCAPRAERAHGSADVRAVETQTDALLKLVNVLLSNARIGAADARLLAFKTLLDAANKFVADAPARIGMLCDHLSCKHL
jgi:hypothetical protein